jgi:hypothetical protein
MDQVSEYTALVKRELPRLIESSQGIQNEYAGAGMVRMLIPRVRYDNPIRDKFLQDPNYGSLQIHSGILHLSVESLLIRRPISQRMGRSIRIETGPVARPEIVNAVIRKTEEDPVLGSESQFTEGMIRLLLAKLPILDKVPWRHAARVNAISDGFLVTVSVSHEDHPHSAFVLNDSLDESPCSKSLVVRMRGEHDQTNPPRNVEGLRRCDDLRKALP